MIAISFIIPCFNKSREISRAIESVVCYCNCSSEVLVIDDASTDESCKEIMKCQERFPLLRVVKSNKNRGISRIRNLGIRLSQGEFLYFLDGDDAIVPGFPQELALLLTRHTLDLLSVQGRWRNSKKIRPRSIDGFLDCLELIEDGLYSVNNVVKFLETSMALGGSQLLARKSWIGRSRFAINECAFEDFGFYFKLLRADVRWLYLQRVGVVFDDQPFSASLSRSSLRWDKLKRPAAMNCCPSIKIEEHLCGVWVYNCLMRLPPRKGLLFLWKYRGDFRKGLRTRYGVPGIALWGLRLIGIRS